MANHFRRQIHGGKSIRKSQTVKSLDKNAVEILKNIKIALDGIIFASLPLRIAPTKIAPKLFHNVINTC
jgi:hypothetical protein